MKCYIIYYSPTTLDIVSYNNNSEYKNVLQWEAYIGSGAKHSINPRPYLFKTKAEAKLWYNDRSKNENKLMNDKIISEKELMFYLL
jgi:hypothetical protein